MTSHLNRATRPFLPYRVAQEVFVVRMVHDEMIEYFFHLNETIHIFEKNVKIRNTVFDTNLFLKNLNIRKT